MGQHFLDPLVKFDFRHFLTLYIRLIYNALFLPSKSTAMQRASLFALLFAITLQGCGYKGPLQLPTGEPVKPATTEPSRTEPNHQDNKP
jgi:predicted small lipoprotein YifL